MDRMPLPPESFFEGTPPHVRAYIEQLHATIDNLQYDNESVRTVGWGELREIHGLPLLWK